MNPQLPTFEDRLHDMGEHLGRLESKIDSLGHRDSTIIPIQHLDDREVVLSQPMMVVVTDYGDGYLCQFVECNLSASGDTQFEAVENFKDILVTTFKRWSRTPGIKLGPAPTRQFRILEKFLGLKGGGGEPR